MPRSRRASRAAQSPTTMSGAGNDDDPAAPRKRTSLSTYNALVSDAGDGSASKGTNSQALRIALDGLEAGTGMPATPQHTAGSVMSTASAGGDSATQLAQASLTSTETGELAGGIDTARRRGGGRYARPRTASPTSSSTAGNARQQHMQSGGANSTLRRDASFRSSTLGEGFGDAQPAAARDRKHEGRRSARRERQTRRRRTSGTQAARRGSGATATRRSSAASAARRGSAASRASVAGSVARSPAGSVVRSVARSVARSAASTRHSRTVPRGRSESLYEVEEGAPSTSRSFADDRVEADGASSVGGHSRQREAPTLASVLGATGRKARREAANADSGKRPGDRTQRRLSCASNASTDTQSTSYRALAAIDIKKKHPTYGQYLIDARQRKKLVEKKPYVFGSSKSRELFKQPKESERRLGPGLYGEGSPSMAEMCAASRPMASMLDTTDRLGSLTRFNVAPNAIPDHMFTREWDQRQWAKCRGTDLGAGSVRDCFKASLAFRVSPYSKFAYDNSPGENPYGPGTIVWSCNKSRTIRGSLSTTGERFEIPEAPYTGPLGPGAFDTANKGGITIHDAKRPSSSFASRAPREDSSTRPATAGPQYVGGDWAYSLNSMMKEWGQGKVGSLGRAPRFKPGAPPFSMF